MTWIKETAIATGVVTAWICAAAVLQQLTGHDGFRLTGYLIMAIGLVLAAWKWRTRHRQAALVGAAVIIGTGALVAFQH